MYPYIVYKFPVHRRIQVGSVKRLKPKTPGKTAQKSQYRPEYRVVFDTLRELRLEAGLTQTDLAVRLGRSQNFVSQAELGYKRLDGLQLWDWSHACGSNLEQFGHAVEAGVNVVQVAAGTNAISKRKTARKTTAKGKKPTASPK